jgi:DNA-binding transcriptional ArsR family regulator
VTKEWSPEGVIGVLGDDHARKILVLAHERPRSASELADRVGVSPPTVYRRTSALVEYGLLAEETRIDTTGNNYRVYSTAVDAVLIEVSDDDLTVRLRPRGLIDRFERFWSRLEHWDGDG